MGCNYNYIQKNGATKKIRNAACFSAIYFYISEMAKKVEAIVPKKFYSSCLKRDVVNSKQKVNRYIKYLQKMGLPILGYEEHDENCYYTNGCWSVNVDTQSKSEFASLVALNAIRYLYEDYFPNIVDCFLELATEKSKMHLFNRFLVSHRVKNSFYNINHQIYPLYGVTKLYSNEEIKWLMEYKTTRCRNVASTLLTLGRGAERESLSNILESVEKGKRIPKIKEFYKNICQNPK